MKFIKIIILLVIAFSIYGCGDTPVFEEMANNRLKVVIKGTFETESITSLPDMSGETTINDDWVDTNGSDNFPSTFMFDIAELRLNGKKFANYRQVHEFSLTGDGSSEAFFNGTGVILNNDDPGEGNYDTVQVYIRKMIFDGANDYTGGLVYERIAQVIFNENTREGFDFNQLQVNSYWDGLRLESSDILRNFPIEIPIIGGLQYSRENGETVLEIRFVIKNFIKKYQYDYYDSGVYKTRHYYAMSDWLRDVKSGEINMGRNLHAVARAYIPGKTGSVAVTAVPATNYVIAIPENEVIEDYYITDTGVQLRSVNPCDLPKAPKYPGGYIESVLDYYLKYEKYKNDFNNKIYSTSNPGGCRGFDSDAGTPNYTDSWDAYENAVENYKIAPYVAYSGSGSSVTFNNIAPGKYKFYRFSRPAYGALFSGAGSYTAHNSGTAVDISVGVNPDITF